MKTIEAGEMLGIRGFFLNEYNQFSAKCINISQIVVVEKKNFVHLLKFFKEDYLKFCHFRD